MSRRSIAQALLEKEANAAKMSTTPPKKKQKVASVVEDPPSVGAKKDVEASRNATPPPLPFFTINPYIPMEDRLVTLEDIALGDGGVDFSLANSMTLPRVRESLNEIDTPVLGLLSFQFLIVVSILFYFLFVQVFCPFLTNLCHSFAICLMFCQVPYLADQRLEE